MSKRSRLVSIGSELLPSKILLQVKKPMFCKYVVALVKISHFMVASYVCTYNYHIWRISSSKASTANTVHTLIIVQYS